MKADQLLLTALMVALVVMLVGLLVNVLFPNAGLAIVLFSAGVGTVLLGESLREMNGRAKKEARAPVAEGVPDSPSTTGGLYWGGDSTETLSDEARGAMEEINSVIDDETD